jgi:hypothetical protein
MEDSAVTLEIAMNVSALMDIMAATVKLKPTNACQTHVKMEPHAKT